MADVAGQEISGGRASPFPGWERFIPHFVHPLKVAIVEAFLYIEEPLSAVQFGKMFGNAGEGFRETNVRYHLTHLVEVGVLEVHSGSHPQTGDAKQKFFYFARLPRQPG